jgi:hypothetical protein
MEVRGKPNHINGLKREKDSSEAKAEDTAFRLPVYFLSFQGTNVLRFP